MRASTILLASVLSLAALSNARQETVNVAHYPDPNLLRSIEDPIAQQIIEMRGKAGLPKLKRVYRMETRQFACTAALQEKTAIGYTAFHGLAMYLSDDQSVAKLALEHIAHDPQVAHREFNKFSVAAWPVSDPHHPPETYGIALMLFPRWGSNWLAYVLTDASEFRNDWKKMVAHECQDVK